MPNYQIKVVDADLVDLVHDLARQVMLDVGGSGPAADLQNTVFVSCKEVLHEYVRGFHVCGCMEHCDEESGPTAYSIDSAVQKQVEEIGPRNRRVRRYILALDVPLSEFMKKLEVQIAQAIAPAREVPALGATVRKDIEAILGKHIFYSPACNRGEYLCQVGVCTEFDPWETIQPREAVTQ